MNDSFNTSCIYWKARQGLILKFGTTICEVMLNSHMKHWAGPRQTGLLWWYHAETHHGLQCPLIKWDHRYSEILRGVGRYFPTDILGQPISPILRGKEIQNESRARLKLTDTISFLGTWSWSNFLETQCFRSQLCIHFQAKKHLT